MQTVVRQAEVGDAEEALRVDEQVVRLKVSVHNAAHVEARQEYDNLRGQKESAGAVWPRESPKSAHLRHENAGRLHARESGGGGE